MPNPTASSADNAKHLTQRNFGAHAAQYVTSPAHASGYSLDRLVEFVNPAPGARILDIATGGGHTALALAQRGAYVIAADLTMPMLVAARDHIGDHIRDYIHDQPRDANPTDHVTYTRLDAEHLPYPSDSFDAVTCRIAAHHFPHVAQFVREVMRVLKPDGVAAIVDQLSPGDPKSARYVNAFERLRDPSHVWAYNAVEWKGFARSAGLTVTHFEDFPTRHNLTAWAMRMGCDAVTITRLRAMLVQAPRRAADWLEPDLTPDGNSSFTIRQFLLVGTTSPR